jgi:hypothetical protein
MQNTPAASAYFRLLFVVENLAIAIFTTTTDHEFMTTFDEIEVRRPRLAPKLPACCQRRRPGQRLTTPLFAAHLLRRWAAKAV